MKQSEMLTLLKELHSDLQRYSAASDSIVPGAYVEALDAAIDQFEKYMWHDAKVNKPEYMKHVLIRDRWGTFVGFYAENADAEGNHWIADDDNVYVYDEDVLQWMYIPEPPKEESND